MKKFNVPNEIGPKEFLAASALVRRLLEVKKELGTISIHDADGTWRGTVMFTTNPELGKVLAEMEQLARRPVC